MGSPRGVSSRTALALCSQRREDVEHVVVGWDLPLLGSDGVELDIAVAIDDEQCWALAEAHQCVDNVVGIEHVVVRVCQKRERVLVVPYETGNAINGVGGDRDDGRACLVEAVDVFSQLREVPTAEWSAEPPQEDQDHRPIIQRVGEVELGTVLIGESEVRGGHPHRRGSAVDDQGCLLSTEAMRSSIGRRASRSRRDDLTALLCVRVRQLGARRATNATGRLRRRSNDTPTMHP